MENIPSHLIKKPKINSSIISVMEVEEISMLHQMKAETLILINGETKLDSNLETA